jgi:hypothetical protein
MFSTAVAIKYMKLPDPSPWVTRMGKRVIITPYGMIVDEMGGVSLGSPTSSNVTLSFWLRLEARNSLLSRWCVLLHASGHDRFGAKRAVDNNKWKNRRKAERTRAAEGLILARGKHAERSECTCWSLRRGAEGRGEATIERAAVPSARAEGGRD